MWQSLPEFGTVVLYGILVAAAYTFAVSIAAGTGRPRFLQAARHGAYGTIALVGLAVLTLAYAFVSHDFRLSYVARYSDRAMTTPYLFAALWGGQDGSLLWWLFLTSVFTGGCVWWMRRKYLELQPYVIATLMSIVMFFGILMIFAVNPFATQAGGAPVDGAGLNYQLRNFYMIIHPPSLYVGFTSAAVPFAFAVAAMITGRLDNEWIVATRKWMLFSWLFLSIGNALGMLWAYEELGWGGYWAWDPVENAACLPWFTASAYVHSTMIQERRGMLKVWNVFLICATFFLTIFGTFLTRSGLIASVHSFAQSGIGIYFVWYMGFIAAVTIALIVYRLPMLRSEGRLESALSRETAFVLNNWGLLSICVFIAIATIWPRISEWLWKQEATVGPPFYNFWIPPVAILIFFAMGLAPLMGWRKTSPELFKKSFVWPTIATVATIALHVAFSSKLRFPVFVTVENLYPVPAPEVVAQMSWLELQGAMFVHYVGASIAWINGKLPLVTIALCGFNLAVVVQEFVRGTKARQKAALERKEPESVLTSLLQLVSKSRRRYGGYIVHVGIVLMFAGFTGRAWGTDVEATVMPGDRTRIDVVYEVEYKGTRRETDPEKMTILADLVIFRNGVEAGTLSPSKNIYKSMPGQPSTEIARFVTVRDDLYVTLAMANPQTKAASFQFHVNPLVSWIWLGVGVLIFGAMLSLWPEVQEQESRAFAYVRAAAAGATGIMAAILLASGGAMAYGADAPRGPPTEPAVDVFEATPN
jgi:cytochrome c-type biogenesis protein CcmF